MSAKLLLNEAPDSSSNSGVEIIPKLSIYGIRIERDFLIKFLKQVETSLTRFDKQMADLSGISDESDDAQPLFEVSAKAKKLLENTEKMIQFLNDFVQLQEKTQQVAAKQFSKIKNKPSDTRNQKKQDNRGLFSLSRLLDLMTEDVGSDVFNKVLSYLGDDMDEKSRLLLCLADDTKPLSVNVLVAITKAVIMEKKDDYMPGNQPIKIANNFLKRPKKAYDDLKETHEKVINVMIQMNRRVEVVSQISSMLEKQFASYKEKYGDEIEDEPLKLIIRAAIAFEIMKKESSVNEILLSEAFESSELQMIKDFFKDDEFEKLKKAIEDYEGIALDIIKDISPQIGKEKAAKIIKFKSIEEIDKFVKDNIDKKIANPTFSNISNFIKNNVQGLAVPIENDKLAEILSVEIEKTAYDPNKAVQSLEPDVDWKDIKIEYQFKSEDKDVKKKSTYLRLDSGILKAGEIKVTKLVKPEESPEGKHEYPDDKEIKFDTREEQQLLDNFFKSFNNIAEPQQEAIDPDIDKKLKVLGGDAILNHIDRFFERDPIKKDKFMKLLAKGNNKVAIKNRILAIIKEKDLVIPAQKALMKFTEISKSIKAGDVWGIAELEFNEDAETEYISSIESSGVDNKGEINISIKANEKQKSFGASEFLEMVRDGDIKQYHKAEDIKGKILYSLNPEIKKREERLINGFRKLFNELKENSYGKMINQLLPNEDAKSPIKAKIADWFGKQVDSDKTLFKKFISQGDNYNTLIKQIQDTEGYKKYTSKPKEPKKDYSNEGLKWLSQYAGVNEFLDTIDREQRVVLFKFIGIALDLKSKQALQEEQLPIMEFLDLLKLNTEDINKIFNSLEKEEKKQLQSLLSNKEIITRLNNIIKPKKKSSVNIVAKAPFQASGRDFLIVKTKDKGNVAFYKSTGTNTPGMNKPGAWLPFGGLAMCSVGPFWFVKGSKDFLGGGDGKVPPPDTELGKISIELVRTLNENQKDLSHVKALTDSLTDGENSKETINYWLPWISDTISKEIKVNKFLQKYDALKNISNVKDVKFWGIDKIRMDAFSYYLQRGVNMPKGAPPLPMFKNIEIQFGSGESSKEKPKKSGMSDEESKEMIKKMTASKTIEEFGELYKEFQSKNIEASPEKGKSSWDLISQQIGIPRVKASDIAMMISSGGTGIDTHRETLENLIQAKRSKTDIDGKEVKINSIDDIKKIKDTANLQNNKTVENIANFINNNKDSLLLVNKGSEHDVVKARIIQNKTKHRIEVSFKKDGKTFNIIPSMSNLRDNLKLRPSANEITDKIKNLKDIREFNFDSFLEPRSGAFFPQYKEIAEKIENVLNASDEKLFFKFSGAFTELKSVKKSLTNLGASTGDEKVGYLFTIDLGNEGKRLTSVTGFQKKTKSESEMTATRKAKNPEQQIRDFADRVVDSELEEKQMAKKVSDSEGNKITSEVAYDTIKKLIDVMSEVSRVYKKRLELQKSEAKASKFTNYEKPLANFAMDNFRDIAGKKTDVFKRILRDIMRGKGFHQVAAGGEYKKIPIKLKIDEKFLIRWMNVRHNIEKKGLTNEFVSLVKANMKKEKSPQPTKENIERLLIPLVRNITRKQWQKRIT